MTTPQIQNDPVITLPVLNINGFIVSNNTTTPNTKLDISAGTARDINNVMDITLGASNANLEGITTTAPLTLNAAIVGASKVYAVYAIADSRYYNATASLLSLASSSTPTMPFGYDSYRIIGYAVTDSSSHFLLMQITGTGNTRLYRYDAPIATAITAGNATSYTAVNLLAFVPNVNNLPVALNFAFTPGAASRTLKFQPGNAVGDAITITGQVTSVVVSDQVTVLAQPTVISTVSTPTINYKVANSGDAVAVNVAGFTFFV